VFFLGIIAIVIMIAAQIIIIRGLWKQQDEMLYLRYRSLSGEAAIAIRGSRVQLFDTVGFILDRYSETAIREMEQIKDSASINNKKAEILAYFTMVLNMEQDQSTFLSAYFEEQGFEKEFNHRIRITNLELFGKDTIIIYRDDLYRERRFGPGPPPAPSAPTAPQPEETRSSILVNRPWIENNNYNLNLDYYIDFSDKQRMILRELSASIIMAVFSTLIVVLIFGLTYRNLMEEKRLSNLKTDFINNMTHELKTPLATITVAGKTLEMERIRTDEAKIIETAKLIGKQSVHLNQLINMILEISMWERTQFQLDKKKVDIAEVLNDIIESFRSGYGNGAQIIEKYNFAGASADLDLVYFTTMINNLLSNAVKYSDKEPVIKIEGYAHDRNICISIADNGIGISKTDQKHVFDKFYRASTGNIHKFKGLGLGLYYVKKIATAHGGDVSVSSKPGKGSIFTVTIPY
jgi:signal transduction histidine kinase